MGEKDLLRLRPLFEFLQENYPQYQWDLDTGHKETAIQIQDDSAGTIYDPPIDLSGNLFIPDIYSHKDKIAIEYQEQPKRKKHRGRLSKKGHTEFSDENKDTYYSHAGIYQIKIWDDDVHWEDTLRVALDSKPSHGQ